LPATSSRAFHDPSETGGSLGPARGAQGEFGREAVHRIGQHPAGHVLDSLDDQACGADEILGLP